MEKSESALSQSSSPVRWIVFAVAVLILGSASFTALRNNPATNTPQDQEQQEAQSSQSEPISLSPSIIVYGTWSGQSSEITAVNLTSGVSTTLASLPSTIKKVTILNPTTLMYINETNRRDHGKKITVYDIKTKKEKVDISADNGFGFDDYVVSPNKQFAAFWEVSFAEGSPVLQGGRSRVYAVNLSNPTSKRLLYDEVAGPTDAIHYPRAILNNGKVLADKFLPSDPNGGTGWAYGMSVVNFDGSDKQDIPQMQNGTYGTQPSLSPDGRYLVFAGYDGARGPGTQIKNGYRQAILTPNTIETLDTETLTRQKLKNLSNANIYSNVSWGNSSQDILLTAISENASQSGFFSYSTLANTATSIKFPDGKQNAYSYLSQLTNDKLLIATTEKTPSSVGNLGEGYANLINQLYVFDPKENEASSLRFNGLIQYITVLPQNYFQGVLGIAYAEGGGGNPEQPNITIIDLYSDKPSQENLQLKTFLMKPELAPLREEQQTEFPTPTQRPGVTPSPTPPLSQEKPRCRDLIMQQCRESNSKDPRCAELYSGNKDAVCYDSPLYVYGTPGKKISVKVQTPVHNDTPVYSDGYDITLQNGGKMQVHGQLYSAIQYDYQSNLKMLKAPTKGAVTDRAGVERVLSSYAKKLGLNEKEKTDLVQVGKKRVTTPYVFISFYDHETSTNILPLSFNPQPENYLNVVFYFKLLDKKPIRTPAPPIFGKPINRAGLTAVEVSEIVE